MKYALIGCGRISANHMKAALETGLEIVAVCDIEPTAMQALLEKYGLAEQTTIRRYADYREMLENETIELAAIATDSGVHAEIALACIDHGVHCIVEKPIAMCLTDADEIIHRSALRDVKVAACHQNRFNLAVQQMRKALEAGRFGKLSHGSVHVNWNRGESYYCQASWRGRWASDGGCLMNQCIHGIDLLRWMMGDEIDTVYGVTRRQQHPYLEAEDVGMAVVRFANGAIATIEGTTNVYPKNLEETLYLFGETGTVKLGGKSINTIDVWQFADAAKEDERIAGFVESTANVYGNGHTSLYLDMIDAITNDHAPYVDARAGRRAVELVLAVYKSELTGEPVRLPLTEFGSTDMEGVFDHS